MSGLVCGLIRTTYSAPQCQMEKVIQTLLTSQTVRACQGIICKEVLVLQPLAEAVFII